MWSSVNTQSMENSVWIDVSVHKITFYAFKLALNHDEICHDHKSYCFTTNVHR